MSGSDAPLSTRVARGVAWAAGAQAIIAIADLVSIMIVMAYLVPITDFGIASLAFPFYTMLDSAADLGVTASLIQRDDHTPERVSTVFWFNMLISGAMFVVLLVIGPLYGRLEAHTKRRTTGPAVVGPGSAPPHARTVARSVQCRRGQSGI